MRFVLLFTLGLLLRTADAAEPFFIQNHDRVVFYGDSITDGEWYPTLVETFVLTRYPAWRNQFSNRGVSGDNSGSIQRFERDVIAQKPQAVVYMMGFNDGGYTPLRPDLLTRFLANVEHSAQLLHDADPRARLLLASPPVNELFVSSGQPWVSDPGYPYTMLMFGQEEGKLAARLGLPFVDIARLYGQTIGLGEVVARQSFALTRDGVHPDQNGQTILAYYFLSGMGAEPLLAETVVDAGKGRLVQAKRCQVTGLTAKNGVVTFQRTCESLPYPTPASARLFSFLVNLDDTLNRDLLVVQGLTASSYVLSVDNQRIAEVAAAELASGLNLSRYPTTPMYAQALTVFEAVRHKDLIEFHNWRQARTNDAARADLAAAERACYALNTPQPHSIKLEPSTNAVPPFAALASADWNTAQLDIKVASVKVDWNAMALADHETTVTIRNPGAAAKSGTVRWNAGSNWTISPATAPFTLAGGQSQVLKFQAATTRPLPAPVVEARWPLTKDWAYPVRFETELGFLPLLTVKHATTKVTLDGDLGDWQDATTFTLDDVHFINLAATGKKLLWNGPADLSAQFFIKWDQAALYLAALVHDDDHIQNETDQMMWSQDILHTAFWITEPGKPDARFEFGFGAYADHDHVVKFMNSAGAVAGPDVEFKSKVDRAAGTCVYEVAIPWARLALVTPQAGKSFRFSFVVCDADSQPGKGYNYLGWTHGISYGKNPVDYATIMLGGE